MTRRQAVTIGTARVAEIVELITRRPCHPGTLRRAWTEIHGGRGQGRWHDWDVEDIVAAVVMMHGTTVRDRRELAEIVAAGPSGLVFWRHGRFSVDIDAVRGDVRALVTERTHDERIHNHDECVQ